MSIEVKRGATEKRTPQNSSILSSSTEQDLLHAACDIIAPYGSQCALKLRKQLPALLHPFLGDEGIKNLMPGATTPEAKSSACIMYRYAYYCYYEYMARELK